ncbi:MAG: sigma-70 family RNA polymerase sigma factor [Lachnospiraceae bacterium]|nr:sigma-70 family RNA polymerase sigma factor [Lachnospiraceae bacterium]
MNTNRPTLTPEEESLISGIYEKYHSNIYHYVYSYIKDEYVASDITADTFALACEKLDQFKDHPNQAGWLYLTAQNKIKEFYRRLKNMELITNDDSDPIFHRYHNSAYHKKELELTLRASLTPEEYKRFQRYFIWGYTISEMADMEGITNFNMSMRLSRLRKKLKVLLRP